MNANEGVSKEFLRHVEDVFIKAKKCTLTFRVENEGITTIKARIAHLQFEPNEDAYLRTDNGLFITLNKIIDADGIPAKYNV